MKAAGPTVVDVLVVGAGFVGLSAALALRAKDPTLRVLVVDAADFAAGGSGRNGAGFRMQWSRDFNIQLSKDSLETFENVEELLEYPGGIDLQQNGYLILAHSDRAMADLRAAVHVQAQFGVPTQLLSVDDCLRIQPGLNASGLRGAAYCPKDGTASPFKWLDALLKANRRAGTDVSYRCKVLSLQSSGPHFSAATSRGTIVAHTVAICTDWAAPELLKPLGVDLPVTSAAKQAMVTEPHAPLVRTAVMAGHLGLGIKQLTRGNIIVTLTQADAPERDRGHTPEFSSACAATAVNLLPGLADARVLRQWSGMISKTPDMQPVIGETALDRLFVAVSAYKGFMMSPQMGRIMADLMVCGHSDHLAAKALSPRRFAAGELVPETLTI